MGTMTMDQSHTTRLGIIMVGGRIISTSKNLKNILQMPPPPLLIGVQQPYLMMSAERIAHVVAVQAVSCSHLMVALVPPPVPQGQVGVAK